MKIDRLLAITVFLLNHERATAKALARHFGVSVRTIQRDMESLSQAGIPVWAEVGHQGGYSILEEYKIRNQVLNQGDIQMVQKALRSLHTSYRNRDLSALIEKYASMDLPDSGRPIYWDFGVTQEDGSVQQNLRLIEQAIDARRVVRFHYRNAQGAERDKTAQPLAVHYKWYAWYVFLWDLDRQDYRTLKVARMSDFQITQEISRVDHGDIEQLMAASERAYYLRQDRGGVPGR